MATYSKSDRLMAFILRGECSLAKRLLEDGADPNQVLAEGATPFHIAVGNDLYAEQFTSLLLQFGANPNVRSVEGLTPLHVATMFDKCHVVDILLKSGADSSLCDQDGKTAKLHAEENFCDLCIVRLQEQNQMENSSCTLDIRQFRMNGDLPMTSVENHREKGGEKTILTDSEFSSFSDTLVEELLFLPKDDLPVGAVSSASSASADSFHSCDSNIIELSKECPDSNPHQLCPSDRDNDIHSFIPTDYDSDDLSITSKRNVLREQSDSKCQWTISAPVGTGGRFDQDLNSLRKQRYIERRSLGHPNLIKKSLDLDRHSKQGLKPFTSSRCNSFDENKWDQFQSNFFPRDITQLSSIHDSVKTTELQKSDVESTSSYTNLSQCSCQLNNSRATIHREDGYSLLEIHLNVDDCVSSCDHTLMDAEDTSTVLYWDDVLKEANHGCVELIDEDILAMTNAELRDALLELGDAAGPILPSTRKLYEARLNRFRYNPSAFQRTKSIQNKQSVYSKELKDALSGMLDVSSLQYLEDQMSCKFINPDQNELWREGTSKSSFNYLLLDPRITKNLPARAKTLGTEEAFRVFIKSIFYIGKGKRARPYSHFKEAMQQISNPKNKPSTKVARILEIWADGLGVVSLHVFQNVIPVEAYTREAAMIQALGQLQLTNIQKGNYYGVSYEWTANQKRLLGVSLLRKTYRIFLNEGERQIKPGDLKQ